MQAPQSIPRYQPGTVLTVGSHTVSIIQYISEGGFAQVYTCETKPPLPNGDTVACLKRVNVPDKPSLNNLRAEVDAMKRLKGKPYIVLYADSHAARSTHGYEVFVLMEYCSRKGLIDFMNTRLTNRLTEPEILNIMMNVCQGIAAMHALEPPLIHRDIKIENVLITSKGEFKVCDFGSVCGVIRPPRNAEEFNVVQYDVMKNTTAQYRCPEMLDLNRGHPIGEKSDIWALGVFLYKLCYYTTPFEQVGDSAILHARYQFPAHPLYSDRLKNLISVLLREDPRMRPNIYQTLEEVCNMIGMKVPIEDFYKKRRVQAQQAAETQLQHHAKSEPNLAAMVPTRSGAQSVPSHAVPVKQIPKASVTQQFNTPPQYNLPAKSQTFVNTPPMPIPVPKANGITPAALGVHPKSPTKLSSPKKTYIPSTSPVKDPFQSIDRSRILRDTSYVSHGVQTDDIPTRNSSQRARPVSMYAATRTASNQSIGEETFGSKMKSFLSSSPTKISRNNTQNTGGSLSSLLHSFSRSRHNTGSRHASDGAYEVAKELNHLSVSPKKPSAPAPLKRSASLQKRIQAFLKADDIKVEKTATGYGEYTGDDARGRQKTTSKGEHKKAPPPKPKKPVHLQAPSMETDFKKRFPSL